MLGKAKDALFFSTMLFISIANTSLTFIHSKYAVVFVKQINLISIELAANCSIFTDKNVPDDEVEKLSLFLIKLLYLMILMRLEGIYLAGLIRKILMS